MGWESGIDMGDVEELSRCSGDPYRHRVFPARRLRSHRPTTWEEGIQLETGIRSVGFEPISAGGGDGEREPFRRDGGEIAYSARTVIRIEPRGADMRLDIRAETDQPVDANRLIARGARMSLAVRTWESATQDCSRTLRFRVLRRFALDSGAPRPGIGGNG